MEFLQSLLIIFGVSAVVVFVLGRMRVPSIVGFLVAGIILGPHGFRLIDNIHSVELLAEIGVILLMFTIGLEFSLKNLLLLRSAVFGGGSLQVLLTITLVTLLSYSLFQPQLNVSVFYGFLVALSSTAIVLKLLMDRAEINAPQGRMSVGILVFQDLCVVPFMLLLPVLAGNGGGFGAVVTSMAKALFVIGIVLLSSRWGVPHVLHEVVKSKSRELFVITIILLCLGTAFLTYRLGLSLALGAFLAGIVISESEYASQAVADILPFKESFSGLFFISVGMLMDLDFFRGHFVTVVSAVLLITSVKLIAAVAAISALTLSVRHALQTGFYLSQIGEFSFVLALAGRAQGLMTDAVYQVFLSSAVLTMMLTPFMITAASPVSEWCASRTALRRLEKSRKRTLQHGQEEKRTGHVIIIGFGVNGRNVARVLKESAIPYVVLEFNSTTVRKLRRKGEPICYGDGTSIEILHKLQVQTARILVVAISDAAATRRIVQIARKENPALHILVRTRFVAETDDLMRVGADEVIPEEFETSIEISSRVLHQYHVPWNIIMEKIEDIRRDSYHVLRTVSLPPAKPLAAREKLLADIDTESYLVKKGAPVAGYSIRELHFRTATGCTIIAVPREEQVFQNPHPDFTLKEGDSILFIGRREDITRALGYFESDSVLSAKYL